MRFLMQQSCFFLFRIEALNEPTDIHANEGLKYLRWLALVGKHLMLLHSFLTSL